MKQARQGDVGIQKIDTLPDGVKPHTPSEKHRIVIAHGEVTGHAKKTKRGFKA